MLPGLIAAFFVLLASGDSFAKEKWEEIAKGQGIRVYKKEVPGRSLPVFRGVGVVKENIFDVLAVLYDVPRRVHWVHKCSSSDVLKEYNELDRLVYSRTAAPWPISDRDVIVRTKTHVDRDTMTVRVTFKTDRDPSVPVVDGVVRMDRLRGYYEIKANGRSETQVTYQVDADPGGLLPAWLVKIASKDLPLKTIANLRKQVKDAREKNTYPVFLKRWRTPENENYRKDTSRADARKASIQSAPAATAEP